jgi:hypothetical protein
LRAVAETEKKDLSEQVEDLRAKGKSDSSKAISLQAQLDRVGDDVYTLWGYYE